MRSREYRGAASARAAACSTPPAPLSAPAAFTAPAAPVPAALVSPAQIVPTQPAPPDHPPARLPRWYPSQHLFPTRPEPRQGQAREDMVGLAPPTPAGRLSAPTTSGTPDVMPNAFAMAVPPTPLSPAVAPQGELPSVVLAPSVAPPPPARLPVHASPTLIIARPEDDSIRMSSNAPVGLRWQSLSVSSWWAESAPSSCSERARTRPRLRLLRWTQAPAGLSFRRLRRSWHPRLPLPAGPRAYPCSCEGSGPSESSGCAGPSLRPPPSPARHRRPQARPRLRLPPSRNLPRPGRPNPHTGQAKRRRYRARRAILSLL